MNAAAFASLFVLVTAAPAFAQGDACALEDKALRPQFAAKLPKGFKVRSTAVDKKKRSVTQVLQLPDGSEVMLSAGGCAHAAYTFAIKTKTITTKTVAAELVAIARRVLPQLPMHKDAWASPAILLKAIEEANINQMPAQLPCGDATCELSLSAVEEKKPAKKQPVKKGAKAEAPTPAADAERPGQLVLSYDFPL